ncbi:CPBP family intramembrane glutamic endopeptidase [Occultella aeris]|uniref:CAAX amino terminal protease self- immunity n=1 Tax=Occultella aeris TaxID=2761496 RepID=A0A7M4DDJ3_9MICO|nr:CPBP family intramembrane glutamic endopeptidase [Occultella aeris]VZO34912.1 CAAX amino terminal protease self- immunity [Occultella aeris]
MTDLVAEDAWRAFWNKGGWWRALLVAAVYLLLYLGTSVVTSTVFAEFIDPEDVFGTAGSVFFAVALPILIGGLLLLAFAISLGWLGDLFGPQPIAGRRWMWIAVALVAIPIVLRLFGTDWAALSVGVVAATLFMGLCVGFAEELLTRGIAVTLLRRAGYGEKLVMVVSSALFALLHSANILEGQAPLTVLLTVVYAFGFGVMMYLVLRVTGSLVWPMLLHAATDPTTALATGGIDQATSAAGSAGLIGIAGVFNVIYPLFAIVAIVLVKGKVAPRPS